MGNDQIWTFVDWGNAPVELELPIDPPTVRLLKKSHPELFGEDLKKGLPPAQEKDEPLKEHRIKHSKRTPPKEYAEGGATESKDYADPKNHKYPIDNEKHVRAAISYFNKPKNYGMYSPAERATMMGRIRRAAKKFGISMSAKGKDLGKSETMSEAWELMKSISEESKVLEERPEDLLGEAEVSLEKAMKIVSGD